MQSGRWPAPEIITDDLERAGIYGRQAQIGDVITGGLVCGVAFVEHSKTVGISVARHEPEQCGLDLALSVDPIVVAKPALAQLAEAERIYASERNTLAVTDRRAIDADMHAVMDVADGRHAPLTQILRDPRDVREWTNVGIGFHDAPQRCEFVPHAKGLGNRLGGRAIRRQMLEEPEIVLGRLKPVPPIGRCDPVGVCEMKLCITFIARPPAFGVDT